ncbi:MACRO domain containing protein 1 [Stemphylium lycopersici]|nr:hypothetical protein TW65_98185 [Stemphylium lycopersici]RAR06842.1 MACRO domain containing protein 1 [Stemphylium lycopersici]
MSSLRLATASNVRAFQNLITVLGASTRKGTNTIDDEALEDEFGRFRVWAGNLGALQKGHSSLDYRLRDAPVSNNNVLKLLDELAHNVNEAYAVLSGARLPYEEQVTTNPAEEDDNDDGFFSEEEEEDEDSDCDEPRSELKVRFEEIIDIIDNLYKLSVRIRTPGIRSRSLRASSYIQKDPETGVEIFGVYAAQDLKHVQELLSHLRQSYAGDGQEEQDFLTTRLSASITLRRRHFKYWKRHRDKLSAPTASEEIQDPGVIAALKEPNAALIDAAELPPTTPGITALRATPSQKTGRTLLSGTEVTQHHQSLDDIVDTKSVTSYAVTVKDVHGKGVDLPPPPKAAAGDKDFECPYCWIRIATFALPHSREDDSDGASSVASRGSSDSELLDSSPTNATNGRDAEENGDYTTSQPAHPELIRMVDPGRGVLSAESLQQLPDDSQNRLNMIQDQIKDVSSSHEEDFTQTSEKQTTLGVDQIPTLRSLYRSRRLLQRDQSYAPNHLYNQLVSFCHYDLTRLKVDAIVNNAPFDLKISPAPGTLHHAVMKAGGPKLVKEAKSGSELITGQVRITKGHDIPSSWILHAVGPTYIGSKGVSQFDALGECYRNALNKARSSNIRTIAFPCLGSGGAGFSPRAASRVALQEVRDYLDAHPEYRFERIVFCVKSAADEKAYTDYFPVFFPPTHGDLDAAKASNWSINRAALAAQILEIWVQVQKTTAELSNEFGAILPKLETNHLRLLRGIDSALASLRRHLLGPTKIERSLGDLSLLCSVLQMFCSSLTDMNARAKDFTRTKKNLQKIWEDENDRMHEEHGADLGQFLEYCWIFANSLDDVLTRARDEWDLTPAVRQTLENYGVKEKGQDAGGIRDHLDEEMYVWRSPPTSSNGKDLIKLQEITSVANLYQLGELEFKPTMAQPSIAFNQTVCLVRNDITKLDIDVIVNSTDPHFLGMGTLDRTIFKKGGPELRDEVKRFGECQAGEVKTTPGYLLPAKHILHAVPPGFLGKDTKNTLRKIYRGILHNATFLGAKSVAIPSIGTGSLNFPRRDSASLAMEEVKRFLESREQVGLEKIVFVVISSNDEFIYRSLLPVYFPPTQEKDSTQSGGHHVKTPEALLPHSLPNTDKSLPIPRDNTLGNVLSNEHPAVMTAKVFVSNISPPSSSWTPQFFADDPTEPFPSRFWTPISQNHCIIHIIGSSVNIYEASERDDGFFLPDSKPIASFELVPTSTAQLDTNPSAATLMHVRRASSLEEERATVSFFCDESLDSKALFNALGRAVKRTRRQSQAREQALPKGAPTNPETSTEGAGDTTSSAEESAIISAESKLRVEGTQDSLSAQVLGYLTNDFNSRPGSYIGQNISDIASALGSDSATILPALQQLAAQKKVHSTIDKDTWVVSDPSRETTVKPSLYQQLHHETLLTARILAYMAHEDRTPEERKGQTVGELAEALHDTSAGVNRAIMTLVSQHQIDSSNDPEKWTLTLLGEQAGHAINAEKKKNTKELDPSAEVVVPEMQPGNTLADDVLSTLRKWPEGRHEPDELDSELRAEKPARGETEPEAAAASHGESWRHGKGEKGRKQARSNRALAEYVEDDELEYYERNPEWSGV